MIKKFLQRFYLVLIFVLLYAPIVTLMVLSFNKSKTRSKWGGFTTKWYVELFKNEQIMNALYTTLIIERRRQSESRPCTESSVPP